MQGFHFGLIRALKRNYGIVFLPILFDASNNNIAKIASQQTKRASGIFTWIIATDTVHCDASAADSFGFDPTEVERGLPIKCFLSRIHPDDLAAIGNAIRDAIVTGEPYQEEYRICRPDGSIVKVAAFGSCFRDASGEPSHYAGMIVPIEDAAPSDENLFDLCLQAYGVATRSGSLAIADKIGELLRELSGGETSAEPQQRRIS